MKNKHYLLAMLALAVALATGCGSKHSQSASAASLDDLDRAVAVMSMKLGKFPPLAQDIEGFLKLQGKTMPTPPPGKKLFLDEQTRHYRWVEAN